MYSRDEPFLRSLECYFGIYFPRCFATREIYNKITHSRALKQFVTWLYTYTRSPVNFPHKGQWRGALTFSLICAWTNGSANYRDAGDLRRHQANYDVTVMIWRSGTHRWIVREPDLPKSHTELTCYGTGRVFIVIAIRWCVNDIHWHCCTLQVCNKPIHRL